MLIAPLNALAPQTQVVVWFWISIAAAAGAWRELLRLDRWGFADQRAASANRTLPIMLTVVAVGVAALPALHCLQRGQVGILQLYLTLLGLRLLLTSERMLMIALGGAVLALAITLKLTPLLPAVVVIAAMARFRIATELPQWFDARSFAAGTGLALGLVVSILLLPTMLVGWQRNLDFLSAWQSRVASKTTELGHDRFAGDSHSPRNQSPANAAWRCGNFISYMFLGGPDDRLADRAGEQKAEALPMDGPAGLAILQWLRRITLLVAGLGIAPLVWRGDRRSMLVAFVLANVATLLVVPIARVHYFMAALPAAIWIPCWLWPQVKWNSWAEFRRSSMQNPACAILAFGPVVLLLLHYTLLGSAGRVGLLGLGMWAWFVWTSGLVFSRCFTRSPRTALIAPRTLAVRPACIEQQNAA